MTFGRGQHRCRRDCTPPSHTHTGGSCSTAQWVGWSFHTPPKIDGNTGRSLEGNPQHHHLIEMIQADPKLMKSKVSSSSDHTQNWGKVLHVMQLYFYRWWCFFSFKSLEHCKIGSCEFNFYHKVGRFLTSPQVWVRKILHTCKTNKADLFCHNHRCELQHATQAGVRHFRRGDSGSLDFWH